MKIIDGHSHLYQAPAPCGQLKGSAKEIEGFDINLLLKRLDELQISQVQLMPQEMTRIVGHWLGSNELSPDIQRYAPERIIAFAGAEPLNVHNAFNRARLKEIEEAIVERNLKGLLLTPPYGHYYSNDKRVYPFYEKAVELDIPIYFHHSHMYILSDVPGCPATVMCPLKYARVWLLEDVAIDFPELRFNVEHLGYPWEEELFALMVNHLNVFADIAMFIEPLQCKGRRLLLARDLGIAREYGVLNRVFWGSDYVGESVEEYISLVQREIRYIKEGLNQDMERLGWPPLTEQEMEGLLSENVLKLWQKSKA